MPLSTQAELLGLNRSGLYYRPVEPAEVITTLAVLRFDTDTREMALASVHPGVTVEPVLENTGLPPRVAPEVTETPAPAEAELAILRKSDPQGFWTG